MSYCRAERTTHLPMSQWDRRGGTIINIITGVIFLGLFAAGVFWVIKLAGTTTEQYTTAMINTKHNATTLSRRRR